MLLAGLTLLLDHLVSLHLVNQGLGGLLLLDGVLLGLTTHVLLLGSITGRAHTGAPGDHFLAFSGGEVGGERVLPRDVDDDDAAVIDNQTVKVAAAVPFQCNDWDSRTKEIKATVS